MPEQAAGQPVEYRPAEPGPTPEEPEGVRMVPVEAEMREGEARDGGSPAHPGLRAGPTVSRAGAPGPLSPGLVQRGLVPSAVGQGNVLVPGGTTRADGPGDRLWLEAGRLHAPSGPAEEVRSIFGLEGESASLELLTLAHDPFADRFVVAGLAGRASGGTLRVAVSRSGAGSGGWHLAPLVAALEVGERLAGLAIDPESLYVVLESGTGRRVLSVGKGDGGTGFYAGHEARMGVTPSNGDGRGGPQSSRREEERGGASR